MIQYQTSCPVIGCTGITYNYHPCAEHRCKYHGCVWPKQKGKDRCINHSCAYENCDNIRSYGATYCQKHKCYYCYQVIVNSNTKFCVAHNCRALNCTNYINCPEHKCMLCCYNNKIDNIDYCLNCKCSVLYCFRPKYYNRRKDNTKCIVHSNEEDIVV